MGNDGYVIGSYGEISSYIILTVTGLNVSHHDVSVWILDRALDLSERGKGGLGKRRRVIPCSVGRQVTTPTNMAHESLLMAMQRQISSVLEGAILNLGGSFLFIKDTTE